MADRIELTEQDLLEAILQAQQASDTTGSALTMRQLMEQTGWGDVRVRDRLRQLQRQGRLEAIKVPCETIDGRTVKVPAYRLKSGG